MNPYDAQTENAHTKPDDETTTPRRFRWFVIPAALSWCFGGLTLLALPFGIYHTIGTLILDPDADWPSRMMSYASIVMIPAMLIAGLLNLLAGFRWLRGRWITALIFNAIAYGVMAIPQLMHVSAMDAARQM
jgi:hypothetical protein